MDTHTGNAIVSIVVGIVIITMTLCFSSCDCKKMEIDSRERIEMAKIRVNMEQFKLFNPTIGK
jgi:hypothetical protein